MNIEKKYEANPNETNLLDLLFTLLAQDESLYKLIKEITSWKDWLNYGEYIVTGELDTKIKKVRYMLENIEKVFDDRYCSLLDTSHSLTKEQIKNNEDDNPYNNTLKRGELMYLLVESHSTSRRWLHKEIKEFLEKVGAKK